MLLGSVADDEWLKGRPCAKLQVIDESSRRDVATVRQREHKRDAAVPYPTTQINSKPLT